MIKLNQKGAVQFIIPLILLVGIIAGVYLIGKGTNLFPKADVANVFFVDEGGNPITTTSSATVKVKVVSPSWVLSSSLFVKEALAQITVPADPSDSDKDGWNDTAEAFIGTDPKDACPDNRSDNAWPPDVDNNKSVNSIDMLIVSRHVGSKAGDRRYNKRYDVTADGKIDSSDVLRESRTIGRTCTNTEPSPTPSPTPTPSSSPVPSISPTPSPTPTPTPTPAPTTVSMEFAEDPNFTSNKQAYSFTTDPVAYTFSSSAAGVKTLYVKFIASNGQTQNGHPFPATIQLGNSVSGPISPSPTLSPSPSATPTSTPITSSVKIKYPNGGESFKVGELVNVTWTTSNVDSCRLGYVRSGETAIYEITVISNPSVGSFAWTVGNEFTTETQIMLSLRCTKQIPFASVQDQSDNFITIKPSNLPPSTSYKRVFVTSQRFNGNLGGLGGADARCQGAANNGGLGGNWKAWLSDNVTSASSRITHFNGSYKLLNGITIANNWDDLTTNFDNFTNPLGHTINIEENGFINTQYTNQYVWTSTDIRGNSYGSNCENWTNGTYIFPSGPGGAYGTVASIGDAWTQAWGAPNNGCSNTFRLYCFEQ